MRLLLVLCCVVIPSVAGAQADDLYGPPPPPPAPAEPSLYCPEPSKDWGTVLSGEDVEMSFDIFNKGQGVLKIENVRPSCGCQAVRYDKTVMPGAKGEIVIKMKTRGLSHRTRKSATVQSNDPKNAKVVLSMGGDVKPMVKFEPPYPNLEGLRGEQLTTTVTMKRQVPGNLEIVSMEPQSKTSELEYELTEIKPGEEFEITLKIKTDATTKVYYYGRPETLNIKAKLDGKELEIPLRARLKLVETVNPSKKYVVFRRPEVELFYKGQGQAPVRTISLKGWQDRTFSITDVEVSARQLGLRKDQAPEEPPVEVAFDKGAAKSEHDLTVKLRKVPAEKKRATSCELVIKTDDPLTPEIKIRATVYFPYQASSISRTRSTSSGRVLNSTATRRARTLPAPSQTPRTGVIQPRTAPDASVSKGGTTTGSSGVNKALNVPPRDKAQGASR